MLYTVSRVNSTRLSKSQGKTPAIDSKGIWQNSYVWLNI